tara:strand:+ start:86 stop:3580 length:3495 start_codon:yes stop_codon:yes gene_type:complete
MSNDHITIRYEDVLKSNNLIKGVISQAQDGKIEKYREYLTHDVTTAFDNRASEGFTSMPPKSIQPHQTFAQRLKGKQPKNGRIRGNLMSRRVEMSARSVITPDPMIDLDEIGLPKHIAMRLTYPEKVTLKNIEFLKKCINNGPDEYPGAENILINSKKIKPGKNVVLNIGDIVNRHLIDGDIVIMNRQPTLHKKSMMGHRVRIMPGYSFRLNVNVTEPYNADFDGDEMNLHCPQSTAAVNEAYTLAGLKNQSMSPASNSPAIAFIQDNVLACYNMTKDSSAFTRRELMNVLSKGAPYYYGKLSNKKVFSGNEVMTFFTPDYSIPSSSEMKKKDLFNLVKRTYHENGIKQCFAMSGYLQKLLCEYMSHKFYSIGPKDLVRSKYANEKVDEAADDMMKNIENYINNIHSSKVTSNKNEFEKFINEEIQKASNKSEAVLQDKEESRFKALIVSGSKGKKKNISQMKGFVGQQIVNGKRTNTGYSNRTLPHFYKYSEDAKTRGFIRNSFSTGLHPYEFFFHAGGGREGLIEQALQTGQTGYIQRQMIKTLEDMVVCWNNTVSDAQGNIVQFLYGDDGVMGESIEVQKIDTLSKSLKEMEISHSLTIDDTHWKVCIDASILKKYPQDLVLHNKFFDDYMKLRNEFVEAYLPSPVPNECQLAVNVLRKLELLTHKFNLNKEHQTDLDPTSIIKQYTKLFENCTIHKYSPGIELFKLMVLTHASPKALICVYRVTRIAFNYFLKDLESSFKNTRIEPGEPVGMIAAQSIGEPCTQLTLNSFHFAGAGRAQGVPRLKELMYLESNGLDGATTLIYLKKPFSLVKENTLKIVKEIEGTKIGDIMTGYELLFESKASNNAMNDDLTQYLNLENSTGADESKSSPFILKLEFLEQSFDTITDVWKCIDKSDFSSNVIMMYDKYSIMFRIDIYETVSLSNGRKIINKDLPFNISQINDIIDNSIAPRYISGIQRLRGSEIKSIVSYYKDDNLGSINKTETFMIETVGTNMKELFKNPAVDTNLTVSNNILDMYDLFGIEVARTILIQELSSVLKDVGTLDSRHISVLADRMVGKGYLTGTNSRGMEPYNSGPLAKASFEKVVGNIRDAAFSGDIDYIKGISANIMVGQAPPLGTGIVDVSINENSIKDTLFNKNNLPKIKPTKYKKHERDINFSVD